MVIVAQWLEHQVVDLDVGGSNPLGHPNFLASKNHMVKLSNESCKKRPNKRI